jgi:hypothetical protein
MKTLFTLLLLLSATCSFAQSTVDLTKTVAINTGTLNGTNYESYLSPRSYRYEHGERASAVKVVSIVFASIGGALVGFGIGSAASPGDIDSRTPMIAGGCFLIGAFTLHLIDRKMNHGYSYIRGLPKDLYTGAHRDVQLNLTANANNLGLQLEF